MTGNNKVAQSLETKGLMPFLKRHQLSAICILTITIILFSSIIRFRSGEIDYFDSDATWHALYTIECYNETPVSQHLFLPIVSMGGDNNKWINWGASVPDSLGNYYYTSFSPAGYFVPWLFMKVFNLPVEEKSLYSFNTFLLSVSAVVLILLLWNVYENNELKGYLAFTGALAYVLVPEVLHGMGIVYWNQSIMQVTLLFQIFVYYKFSIKKDDKYKIVFYVMAVINPYIEWTGYVANVGFAVAEVVRNWKKDLKTGLLRTIFIGLLTVASFVLFCLHYLLRVDKTAFFTALENRFLTRNLADSVLLTEVIGSYLKSFEFLWVVIAIFVIWSCIKIGFIKIENGILILVSAFPVLENFILKQHAIAYSYDRMKAVFVVVLILCELQKGLIAGEKSKRTQLICLSVIIIASLLNFKTYAGNTSYVWNVDYREYNTQLADYVTDKYPDALYASDTEIRGYMNLLFNRGIYENQSMESAEEIAKLNGKETVVFIKKDGYKIKSIVAEDLKTGEITEVNSSK